MCSSVISCYLPAGLLAKTFLMKMPITESPGCPLWPAISTFPPTMAIPRGCPGSLQTSTRRFGPQNLADTPTEGEGKSSWNHSSFKKNMIFVIIWWASAKRVAGKEEEYKRKNGLRLPSFYSVELKRIRTRPMFLDTDQTHCYLIITCQGLATQRSLVIQQQWATTPGNHSIQLWKNGAFVWTLLDRNLSCNHKIRWDKSHRNIISYQTSVLYIRYS